MVCSPWIGLDWEATSETVATGLMFEREIGVKGGEVTLSGLFGTWGDSKCFATCNVITLWLLDGIEKLRETTNGGVGRGDALFDATEGTLFVAFISWLLYTNGAEWPTKPGDLDGLAAKLPGGLGSSWSSLILGEDTSGGEALGDTFGDEEWGIGKRETIPETSCGNSVDVIGPLEDKAGFVDDALLVNRPEEACLLIFLLSDALTISSCGRGSPSARGGGNRVEVLVLLSLSCAFKVLGPDKLPSP